MSAMYSKNPELEKVRPDIFSATITARHVEITRQILRLCSEIAEHPTTVMNSPEFINRGIFTYLF